MSTSPGSMRPARESDRRRNDRRRTGVRAVFDRDERRSVRGFSLTAPRSATFIPALIDVCLVGLALVITVYAYRTPWREIYYPPVLLAAIVYPSLAGYLGVYSVLQDRILALRHLRILFAWMLVMGLLLILAYGEKQSALYPRRIMLTWLGITPLLLMLVDVLRQPLLRVLRSHAKTRPERVAVFGFNPLAERLVTCLQSRDEGRMEFAGYYDDRDNEPVAAGDTLTGSFEQLLEDVGQGHVNSIYIVLPMRAELRIRELLERLSDTTASVQWVPDLFAFRLLRSELSVIDGIPTIGLFQTPFREVNAVFKRLEDIILTSVILTVIVLPMLVIALSIRLSSRGPALFRQRRYGIDGRAIEVLKFRSMSVSEDDPNTIIQARRDDPRVTRLGRFLRRTSLDELPQFFNVLGGSMSVVGPRPHAIAHNEQYRRLIGGYMLRHKVKPGITGWAQVNGLRGEIGDIKDMQQRIRYDLDYIDHWSLLFDLYIVVLTVFKGFGGERAY